MQLCKSCAELKLLAVDRQGTESAFFALHRIRRQTLRIYTKEITHARTFEFEIARYAVKRHHMHDILLHRAKDPLQHVVEMHTDVGRYTAGLMYVTFPTAVVPLAAAGDIRQIHIIDLVLRPILHFLLQRTDLIVQTQLQDRISLMSRLRFQFHQVVDVVGVEHQRFLTDHIASQTQTVTDERIVRIVRRADRHPTQRVVRTHLLGAETVKLLILRVERTIRKGTVQTTYTVKLIIRHKQIIARIGYRFDMSRSNISGCSDQCKI